MELTSFSATTLARFIRTNLVSSVAVVDAHLARLEAVNPELNAVVQLHAEAARQQARAADEAVSRGERLGPIARYPHHAQGFARHRRHGQYLGDSGASRFYPPSTTRQ